VCESLGLFPVETASPATYALAGMAGMLAAVAHCPLTAFLLIFELTQDYKVILPVMLVAILATVGSQYFQRDSIYALRLRQMGLKLGVYSDMTLLSRLNVTQVPLAPAVTVHPQDPVQKLLDLAEQYSVTDYAVVDDNNQYVGMVVGEDIKTTLLEREAIPLMIVEEVMRTDLPTVSPEMTLDVVMDKFSSHEHQGQRHDHALAPDEALPPGDRSGVGRVQGVGSRVQKKPRDEAVRGRIPGCDAI